ncbi:MAG: hypothetical protein QOF76_68 [Solirubrobacteraceae bacterium]|jgi:hypothetical protein|nr:hypothetical protein [Solirubrobacteraceae bacterium]
MVRTMAIARDPTDLELAREAQAQMGRAIRRFLRERTAVESPLFDVAAKMVYGNYAAARTIPTLVDLLDARLEPEEVARRLRVPGIPLGLAMYGIAWAYSLGRLQLYLDAGWPARDVELDDDEAAKVMTWWARAMRAYRSDGLLVPGEAGAPETIPTLPPETVDALATSALAHGAPADPPRLRRSIAELDLFEFVTHAEARDGIHQHGPYPLSDGTQMLVKEFTDLQARHMPSITAEHHLAEPRVVIALVLRDVQIRFDLFSVYVDPDDYFDRIVGVEILAGDDLHPITEEELAAIAAGARTAQRKYFVAMAGWDDRLKVTHGATQYANDFHAPMLYAGYSQDEVKRLLVEPFERNAEDLFDRAVGAQNLRVFEHVIGDAEPVLPPIRG